MKKLLYTIETGAVVVINPSKRHKRSYLVEGEGDDIVRTPLDALHEITKEDLKVIMEEEGALYVEDGVVVRKGTSRKPIKVTRRQLREALTDEQEEAITNGIGLISDEATRRRMKVWWEDHKEFAEDHPMVVALVADLGWEDLAPALFEKAATL